MAQAGSTVRIIKKRSKISLDYPFTGTVWQTLNLSLTVLVVLAGTRDQEQAPPTSKLQFMPG